MNLGNYYKKNKTDKGCKYELVHVCDNYSVSFVLEMYKEYYDQHRRKLDKVHMQMEVHPYFHKYVNKKYEMRDGKVRLRVTCVLP